MYCPICGTNNKDGVKFCANCGFSFAEYEVFAAGTGEGAAPAYEAPKPAAPAYEAPKAPTPAYEAPKQAADAYGAPVMPKITASSSSPFENSEMKQGSSPYTIAAILGVAALVIALGAVFIPKLFRGQSASASAVSEAEAPAEYVPFVTVPPAEESFAVPENDAATDAGDVSYADDAAQDMGNSEPAAPAAEQDNAAAAKESEPAPLPAEAAPEMQITLLPSEPDLTGMHPLKVPAADASSTIDQSDIGVSNAPVLMFDGRDDTSWQEGADGYGVGEYANCYFEEIMDIRYIGFKLGNWKSDKLYGENAKPRTLAIRIGDVEKEVTFTGNR